MIFPKDFFETYKYDGRPFVLAGMGPSFSHIKDYNLSAYNVLGINKVVREIPVNLCHIIDWYIVDKVKGSIQSQADYLVCPYWPHFHFHPNAYMTLHDCMQTIPFPEKVLGYNLSTFPLTKTQSPIVKANYFNAEASLNLIAHLGCKKVLAIGIDGGDKRAEEFSDHGPCDPRGFDLQWPTMARTIVRHGIDYSNIDGSKLNPVLQEALDALLQKV